MSSLLQKAKTELRSAGLFAPDADYDGMVAHSVVSLMETFVAAGHSGGSAEITLALFERLAHHKPITPLTGEDSEWEDRSEMSGFPLWQNNRYSSVFKNKQRAWIVLEPSRSLERSPGDGKIKDITFPYTVA